MKNDKLFDGFGVWRSPVAHLLWEQGVGGSNPLTPTIPRLADGREIPRPSATAPWSSRPAGYLEEETLMADSVKRVAYFKMMVPNRAGRERGLLPSSSRRAST